ncbi:MAG: TonB-dependent receptor [Bacteroidota bacterium]
MRKHLLILLFAVFSTTSFTFAQSTKVITGKLLDAQSKEPLIGATVNIKGTTKATSVALDGSFKISVPADGSTLLVFSYIGYVSKTLEASGKMGIVTLDPTSSSINEVKVTGTQSIAIARRTPIAVSAVSAQYIEEKGAGAEFPELLKNTPGITVTRSGGGYGDSRVAIRGFNSQNTALLINGLPANDPETGRIFWNDWAGLSDVTTSMQVQRGLGASTVAVPSLGGTMNVTTKSTEAEPSGAISQSIGSYNALKTAVSYSTGLSSKGWASSFLLSKSTGDGNAEGLYYTGYTYFANISKVLSKNQTISANIFGATQNHGQRFTYLNINTYRAAPQGAIRYNSDYGYLNGQLKSAEVNFYNKPLASVTHTWNINPSSSLATVLYGTWGSGAAQFITGTQAGLAPGGSAPRTGDAYSPIDFNAIVKTNLGNVASQATTILQNAANDHQQYGVFSTYKKKVGDNINILAGLDLRTYQGQHYYKVNDLLGGSYFIDNTDLNNPNRHTITGDKINRNYNLGLMSEGLYLQGEYSKDNLSAYAALAVNNTSNKRTDYYSYLATDPNRESKWVNFLGYQAKGGVNYNIDNSNNIFANVGYLQRAPLVATVFLNNKNDINTNAKPEKLTSFELGYGYVSSLFSLNVNAYYSPYMDRAKVFSVTNQDGTITTLNVSGINEVHQGVEVETKFRPVKGVTFSGMLSIGDYHYTSTTGASQITSDKPGSKPVDIPALYLKGIKIGDFGSSAASNAQTTASLGLDIQALPAVKIGGSVLFSGDYFASYDPSKLTAASGFDVTKFRPLGLPNYSTVDVNVAYRFKFAGLDASFIGNIYNLLNTEYINEGYEGNPTSLADVTRLNAIGVNYGNGRLFMTTLKIRF